MLDPSVSGLTPWLKRLELLLLAVPVSLGVVAWMLLAPMPSANAQTPISLALTPDTIALGHGETASVVVVVTNDTGGETARVDISTLNNANVTVPSDVAIDSIPDGGAASAIVDITTSGEGIIGGVVQFVAVTSISNSGVAVPAVAVATLTITERQPPQAEDLVSGTIITALAKLTDRGKANVFVQVRNESNLSIIVTEVRGIVPDFLAICWTDLATCMEHGQGSVAWQTPDTVLPPHGQETYPFIVSRKIGEVFQSGKQVLVFRVKVSSEANNGAVSSLILEHDFETVVFGESEILTPLGLASFLVLPGFLLVVVWGGLWQYAWPRRPLSFLGPTKSEFWILVITASLAAIPVYEFITNRDLLDGYDSTDLFTVWTGSVLLGLVFWGVSLGLGRMIGRIQSRRRTFVRGDSQRKVIIKLARMHDGLSRKKVRVSLPGGSHEGLLLTEGQAPTDRDFVAPPIAYRFAGNVSELAKSDFQVAVATDDMPHIRKAIGIWPWSTKVVTLGWARGSLLGVTECAKGHVTDLNNEATLLEPG